MGDARQAKELAMSPKTRAVYKDFSHKLRSKDTQSKGMRHAQDLAQRCMAELPESVHWRVDLEMADLSKREKARPPEAAPRPQPRPQPQPQPQPQP